MVGIVAGASVLGAVPALAEGYVDASDSPQIVAGQEVDGTAWLGGNSVTVAGTVRGDLFCVGNTITITGVVEGDVLCAGNTLTVVGSVGGDIRLGGNSITISGSSGKATTLAGSSITLADGSRVGSDLTAGAATLNLAGVVGRDARLAAGAATLAGTITRDVDAQVDALTVTPTAVIGGHLSYVSAREATLAPGTVQGEVTRTPPPPETLPTAQPRTPSVARWLVGAAAGVLWLVALTVAVVLLLPTYVRRLTDTTWSGVGKAALVGLVTLAAGLPIIIMAFVTIVGAGAGLLLLVGFPLALTLAGPLAAYYLGREVMRRRTTNMIAMAAVGAAILGLATVVPFLGALVGFAAACVGVGLIVQDLRRRQFVPPAYTDTGGPVTAP